MNDRPAMTRFPDALAYAAALHANQRRKASGEPYVAHLLAVAAIVLENGGDEDEAIAALLHDALEDQGHATSREELESRFGPRVARIVAACSDASGEGPKPPWRQRKEAFLASLDGADASVRLVVAADKLHNVRSLLREHARHGENLWRHFHGGRGGTLWYYRAVTDALHRAGPTGALDELEQAVCQLESL